MFYDNHPTLDVLELHGLRRLLKGESAQIEAHVLECAKCRAMAGELMRQINLIEAAAFAFDSEAQTARDR
jgi:hypothetical protein